jgi:APA family basic amino acid/polyamine antiporter
MRNALALLVPLEGLAESTSLATLVVFALVNLALLRLRYRRVPSNARHVRVPIWMPVVGLVTCVAMIGSALLKRRAPLGHSCSRTNPR